MFWWLDAPPAEAGELPTLPDRALVLPKCDRDPADPCWQTAPRLARFAPPPTLEAAPVEADVRVAWDGGAVLARVGAVPDGARVELVLSRGESDDSWTASSDTGRDGVLAANVVPGGRPGDRRSLRVNLVIDGEDGAVTLPWSPAGPGDPSRGFPVLLSREPAPPMTVTAAIDGDRLRLVAPGSTDLRVWQDRVELPQGEEAPEVWRAESLEMLEAEVPPASGWYVIEATWTGDDGKAVGLTRRRVWLQGQAADAALAAGIHPAPAWFRRGKGELRVGERLVVCAEDERFRAAAELFAEEAARFTGADVRMGCGQPQVRLVALNDADLADDARAIAAHTDGWALTIAGGRAVVAANDTRGAIYGALALADAIGPDRRAPALVAADRPAVPMRVVYHRVDTPDRGGVSPDRYVGFIRRALARGRVNLLVLDLRGAYRYERRPDLADPNAWTRDDLAKVVLAARRLGIEVVPGVDAPGHADWITGAFPELAESGDPNTLCMRAPGTRALLTDVYDELFEVFEGPRFVHIGHDEVFWPDQRKFGDERCPRCAGTPRDRLFAEALGWTLDLVGARGARSIAWADMLLRGWNGGRYGTWRSLELLAAPAREHLIAMSWGTRGDPVDTFAAANIPLIRAHTGYQDHKRGGLAAVSDRLDGEGLALFVPFPWSAFGHSPGEAPLVYHWTNVVLSGTTGWRPDLADRPIEPTLDALVNAPAYLPGYRHPPKWSGRSTPAPVRGAAAALDAVLPAEATVNGVRFTGLAARGAGAEPITVTVGGRVAGVSLLQATRASWAALVRFQAQRRQGRAGEGPEAARVTVRWADGETATVPLRWGLDTWAPEGDGRVASLWETAGALRLPSEAAGATNPAARDRTLYRWDWINPRPDVAVESLTITAAGGGLTPVVAGAAKLERPR